MSFLSLAGMLRTEAGSGSAVAHRMDGVMSAVPIHVFEVRARRKAPASPLFQSHTDLSTFLLMSTLGHATGRGLA
jgi:hypothetical protein